MALTTSLPAIAEPVNKKKPLILGVFPRRNIKVTYKLFSPLAKYLSQELGREVHLETTKSFNEFWKNVQLQKYDIVHFNQYHYVVSHHLYNYEVIAANKELNSETIAGSLIVRKDSGINNVSDLKGKAILFGGGQTAMQSYIAATWLLRQGGLQAGDYIEKFAVNPPNTIISTYFKRADASGSGDAVMLLDNVRNRIDISQLKFLAKTEQMAHLPWAVRGALADEIKVNIKTLITKLNTHSIGKKILQSAHLDELVPVVDSDFNKHRKIIRDVFGKDFLNVYLK